MTGSALSGAIKDHINLLRGWPNPALLPVADLSQASTTVLSTPSIYEPGLQYGPDEGYQPLRQHVAEWLTSFYRPPDPVTQDRICITGGASQNLACVLQAFTDPVYTRNVWIVAPMYYLAGRIFDDSGFAGRLRGIPEDEEGIDLDLLERGLDETEKKAVSEGNNEPVMSLRRRERLVRLARRFDALVVTDDVYDFLQWSSTPNSLLAHPDRAYMPRLIDLDRYLDGGPRDEWGHVVSNGSFSKLIGPGVRTGWAESTEKFSYGLSQTGSSRSGGAPSQLTATVVDQLLSTSIIQNHIVKVLQPAYADRYHRTMSAIQEHLLPLGVTIPPNPHEAAGGYFIWLDLPQPLRASDLAERAMAEENLLIATGDMFQVPGEDSPDHDDFEHSVRICFAWEELDNLTEGIQRLAAVVRRAMDQEREKSRK
ncbi:aminotransferase, putative [Paecilomyces variotii No. 5]|uniref:Aminotransferase, putative n=1 Tax=Byssochlamys spectabilis (strain No. 5 / NBRC 109023) TaxID=1356009 RepID=V5G521_BYSSN|nr:aminotransferase, putative [Paecilomyces variotii No. 5]